MSYLLFDAQGMSITILSGSHSMEQILDRKEQIMMYGMYAATALEAIIFFEGLAIPSWGREEN